MHPLWRARDSSFRPGCGIVGERSAKPPRAGRYLCPHATHLTTPSGASLGAVAVSDPRLTEGHRHEPVAAAAGQDGVARGSRSVTSRGLSGRRVRMSVRCRTLPRGSAHTGGRAGQGEYRKAGTTSDLRRWIRPRRRPSNMACPASASRTRKRERPLTRCQGSRSGRECVSSWAAIVLAVQRPVPGHPHAANLTPTTLLGGLWQGHSAAGGLFVSGRLRW